MTQPPGEDEAMSGAEDPRPSFGNWLGSMWLYTALRFGLFFVLWGLLYLIGLQPLPAAAIGLVLSIPLSFVLLARPRARLSEQIEARVAAHRQARADLDRRLDPGGQD